MRGRPPKPLETRQMEGDRSKRRPKVAVKCAKGAPSKPKDLKGEASKEWDRVTAELNKDGRLALVDRSALRQYCMIYAAILECQKSLDDEGFWAETMRGHRTVNPALATQTKLWTVIKGYMVEFGMTPVARARMAMPAGAPSTDELEEDLSPEQYAAKKWGV